jgi:hypothetical protein
MRLAGGFGGAMRSGARIGVACATGMQPVRWRCCGRRCSGQCCAVVGARPPRCSRVSPPAPVTASICSPGALSMTEPKNPDDAEIREPEIGCTPLICGLVRRFKLSRSSREICGI